VLRLELCVTLLAYESIWSHIRPVGYSWAATTEYHLKWRGLFVLVLQLVVLVLRSR
jgi:hypothetical protein